MKITHEKTKYMFFENSKKNIEFNKNWYHRGLENVFIKKVYSKKLFLYMFVAILM